MTEIDRRGLLAAAAATASLAAVAPVARAGAGAVQSVSAMTFAPDGRLVVADWRAGALHALELPAAPAGEAGPFNTKRLEAALGAADGARARATAVAWDAARRRAVVAFDAGRGPDAPARLALVTRDGAATVLDPSALVAASQPLDDAPPEAAVWRETPVRTLTVTDLKAHGGEILVAGVANSDFASTLRRVPYPFDGRAAAARVEMYHAVHNQIETRAPIRAMAPVALDGVDHLLAAYTCTPLVTAPMAALADGAAVRATTIAELGFGNTPLSITPFEIAHQGQRSAWVIVANAAKAADLIPLPAIAEAAKGPGLTTPVKAPFEPLAGVRALQVPITNLVGLVDQDPAFLLALRREPQSGALELVSYRKGAFFRLSDFVNEYDMPGYDYPAGDAFQQDYIRPFHAMMRTEEGYADLVR
jgi:hypothetical protein